MEINQAREIFLNQFQSRYREHIINFSTRISNVECDIIIFTARKSACFFHCLEYLRIWNPGSKIIISDRLIDHDLSWIIGKRIAIIDEVIVSGTSLYKLWNKLLDAGAREIKVYALFINNKWFVKEFFEPSILDKTYIKLDGPEAQSLGTSIVQAMHSIPRPYSIDYPMSGWRTLTKSDIKRATLSAEWECTKIHTTIQNSTRYNLSNLAFYRFSPCLISNKDIYNKLGFSVAENTILKIRLYGRWEQQENKENQYNFRIVPYVVLGEISEKNLELYFHKLIADLPENEQKIVKISCKTGISKLRFFQYILAGRLGRAWCKSMQQRGIDISFINDSREISFTFPYELHKAITQLELIAPDLVIPIEDTKTCIYSNNFEDKNESTNNSVSDIELYLRLMEPFINLYRNKEIPLRTLAKKLKLEIFNTPQYGDLINRLHEGHSFNYLIIKAAELGIKDPKFSVSSFIDIAVDQGLIVPITIVKHDKKNSYFCRVYRHGEETYLHERDLVLFHKMLSEIKKTLIKNTYENSSLLRLPTFKAGNIPKLVLEKLLVLFIPYCISKGIFTQIFTSTIHKNGYKKISIGRDLHGARVAIGDHLPTEFIQTRSFVKWLQDEKVIQTTGSFGYSISPNYQVDHPDMLDTTHGKDVAIFGAVLGQIIVSIIDKATLRIADNSNITKSHNSISEILNDTLIELTTCENSSSTLIAIGAEFRRLVNECQSFPFTRIEDTVFLLNKITEYKFTNTILAAANSGYMKINAYLMKQADQKAKELSELLNPIGTIYENQWDIIWGNFQKDSEHQQIALENRKLLECANIIVKIIFELSFFQFGLLSINEKNLLKNQEKKLSHIKNYIDKKVLELYNKSDLFSRKNQEFYRQFSKLYLDLNKNLSRRWQRYQQQFDSNNLKEIVKNIHENINNCYQAYTWIDNVFQKRGRLPYLEEFEHILHLTFQVKEENWQNAIQKITNLLIRSDNYSSQGKTPKEYTQSSRNAQSIGNIWIPKIAINFSPVYELFVYGNNIHGAQWLGYLTGNLLNHDNNEFKMINEVIVTCILGLEYSRRVARNNETNDLIVSPLLLDAVSQLKKTENTHKCLTIITDTDKDGALLRNYQDHIIKVMKSQSPKIVVSEVRPVAEMSGEFSYTEYEARNTRLEENEMKAGWIFIVEDEGTALIDVLNTYNIQHDLSRIGHKIARTFEFNPTSNLIQCIVMESAGQGNVDIVNTLTELNQIKPNFIIVLGICCNFSTDKNKLTSVNIPSQTLDTQLKVDKLVKVDKLGEDTQLNTEHTVIPRNCGISVRKDVREIINQFFIERKTMNRNLFSFSDINIDVFKGIMVSDNSLIRNNDREQYHRKMAENYNNKADTYDMETAGVFSWLEEVSSAPPTFVVKGLSDMGDPNKKDDDNRTIAARNAVIISLELTSFVADILRLKNLHN